FQPGKKNARQHRHVPRCTRASSSVVYARHVGARHFGLAARIMRTSEPSFPLDFIREIHHMSRTCRAHAFALIGERSRYLENRRVACQPESELETARRGREKRRGSSITSTSMATATSKPSPKSATPMPITPSLVSPSALARTPPTARAPPSPRPPSYGWQVA